MSKQPEALRLADDLVKHLGGNTAHQAAAELRRLHQSEREGWRYADDLEQERKRLHEVNAELVEALQAMLGCCYDMERNDETLAAVKSAMKAIYKATGEQQ